jgi:Zn-dependent M16 (insulinase) family peptidase
LERKIFRELKLYQSINRAHLCRAEFVKKEAKIQKVSSFSFSTNLSNETGTAFVLKHTI